VRLRWSDEARAQLREAQEFVVAENPSAARRLLAAIREAASRLRDFPHLGHAIEPAPVRSFAVPRTRYLLFYVVQADTVLIISVWHGAREWPPPPS